MFHDDDFEDVDDDLPEDEEENEPGLPQEAGGRKMTPAQRRRQVIRDQAARREQTLELRRRTAVYLLMRRYRVTKEPMGIDGRALSSLMREDIARLFEPDAKTQMGYWHENRMHRITKEADRELDQFEPFIPYGNTVAFYLDPELYPDDRSKQKDERPYWKEREEQDYWVSRHPELLKKWVMKIIYWNEGRERWEEKDIAAWDTPRATIINNYGAEAGEFWASTWEELKRLLGSYGVDRDNRRFTHRNTDSPLDPTNPQRFTVPDSRVGVMDLGLMEWMRLRRVWTGGGTKEKILENRELVYARFRQYSEEDWHFWVEWSGAQVIFRFLSTSREHRDKTLLAREAHQFEWAVRSLQGSVLLMARDLNELMKKAREGRVRWNLKLGMLTWDWKLSMETRITGFVPNSTVSWVYWAYLLHQLSSGMEPDIDEPVTNTPRDKIVDVSKVLPIWSVIRDAHLEPVPGETEETAVNAQDWRPKLMPRIGTPEFVKLEDGMRIKMLQFLFDLADQQTLEWLEDMERRGEAGFNVKLVDDVFDEKGNHRFRSHWGVTRPDDRIREWDDWHRRASYNMMRHALISISREAWKWQDVNKLFDPQDGALYRLPEEQAAVRDQWLDGVDEVWANWLLNGQVGLAGVGGTSRNKVMELFEQGFTKHRKELSPFGHREKLQPFLRFADAEDSMDPYLGSKGANARVLQPKTDRRFGKGYDPQESCVGEIKLHNGVYTYERRLFDHHSHGGELYFCEGKIPGETPLEHGRRVEYMRSIGQILLGWFNKITDHENWVNDYFAHIPDNTPNYDALLEDIKAMVKAGTARSFQQLPFEMWREGGKREEYARSVVEAKFAAISSVFLPGVTNQAEHLVKNAGSVIFLCMMLEVTRFVLQQEREGRIDLNKFGKETRRSLVDKLDYSIKEEFLRTKLYVNGKWQDNSWAGEDLQRMFKEITRS